MRGRIILFSFIFTLAACGGGGSGGGSSTTPIALPTTAPTTAPSSVTIVATNTSAQGLPSAGGVGGTVSLNAASAPAGSTIAISALTAPPAGVLALQSAQGRRPSASANAPIVYYAFTPSTTITLNGLPAFSLTSTLPAGTPVSLALLPAGAVTWQLGVATTVVQAGGAINFPATSTAITLPGGVQTVIVLYVPASVAATPTPAATATPTPSATASPTPSATATPTPSATATPTPAATATPTPAPAIALSPSSLSFTNVGTAYMQSVTVSEAGYTGSFTVTAPACFFVKFTQTGNRIDVTPQSPGSCSMSVSDGTHTATLPITVTQTSVTAQ